VTAGLAATSCSSPGHAKGSTGAAAEKAITVTTTPAVRNSPKELPVRDGLGDWTVPHARYGT
jgi:hypothetical protein